MTNTSLAVLHPVSFGARQCRGNEVRLHSHLEQGFAGDWAMNKCCHMLFGHHFVWVTDCHALWFILLYNGVNPAILHLQMGLMGWEVHIVYRNNHYITDADYWSHLGIDLCFDLLFKTYIDLTHTLCLKNPPSTSFPMKPENMPYYREPRLLPASEDNQNTEVMYCQTIVSTVMVDNSHGLNTKCDICEEKNIGNTWSR
jgi:hypothetical protein